MGPKGRVTCCPGAESPGVQMGGDGGQDPQTSCANGPGSWGPLSCRQPDLARAAAVPLPGKEQFLSGLAGETLRHLPGGKAKPSSAGRGWPRPSAQQASSGTRGIG